MVSNQSLAISLPGSLSLLLHRGPVREPFARSGRDQAGGVKGNDASKFSQKVDIQLVRVRQGPEGKKRQVRQKKRSHTINPGNDGDILLRGEVFDCEIHGTFTACQRAIR